MKKVYLMIVGLIASLALVGCGVPTDEHEALQAEADTLSAKNVELEQQLEDTTAELAAAVDEADELRAAEEERVAKEKEEADRKAKEKAEKEAAKKAEEKKANKAKKVSSRELAQIVKKPDSYIDKNVIIYARITQFDSATGPCTFRADTSHAAVGKYDYEHNTIFTAGDGISNCDVLDDFVADDIVQITATVTGSLSYETQIGGSTTVPEMKVVKIKSL